MRDTLQQKKKFLLQLPWKCFNISKHSYRTRPYMLHSRSDQISLELKKVCTHHLNRIQIFAMVFRCVKTARRGHHHHSCETSNRNVNHETKFDLGEKELNRNIYSTWHNTHCLALMALKNH